MPRLLVLTLLAASALLAPGFSRAERSQAEPASGPPITGFSGKLKAVIAGAGEPIAAPDGLSSDARWLASHGTRGEPRPALSEAGELRAPSEPGAWELESGGRTLLTAIVPVPAEKVVDGSLNGYRIGLYPAGSGIYTPPKAFIEVTPENEDLPVSDRFTLRDFLTKGQESIWPKYLVLDLALVDKLELVLDELAAAGVPASDFFVMSGYRTPAYNGPGGGGRSRISRHLYGDAADVWLDENGDGQMDDLDANGRIDRDDGKVILAAVERVEARHPQLTGGVGLYPATSAHGPFVHIDRRGHVARW
jgi:hypothetical protein